MKRQRSDDTNQLLDDFKLDELLDNRMVSQIDDEILESLKEILNRLDSRKEIIAFASQFITAVTKPRCDDPLVLTLETKQENTISFEDATERIRGQTFQILGWSPFINEEYLVLKSSRGDLLSVLGIESKKKGISPLEITSDTPERQMRRKYNTILRSVAVIIGFKEKSAISSAPITWISAYALLSKYHTTERFSLSNEIKPPMKSEDALSYIKENDIDEIVVPPLKQNFDIATEILFKTAVECYNYEPPEGVS